MSDPIGGIPWTPGSYTWEPDEPTPDESTAPVEEAAAAVESIPEPAQEPEAVNGVPDVPVTHESTMAHEPTVVQEPTVAQGPTVVQEPTVAHQPIVAPEPEPELPPAPEPEPPPAPPPVEAKPAPEPEPAPPPALPPAPPPVEVKPVPEPAPPPAPLPVEVKQTPPAIEVKPAPPPEPAPLPPPLRPPPPPPPQQPLPVEAKPAPQQLPPPLRPPPPPAAGPLPERAYVSAPQPLPPPLRPPPPPAAGPLPERAYAAAQSLPPPPIAPPLVAATAAVAAGASRLDVINRDGWRKEFPLRRTLAYVGSQPGSDICLPQPDVAPRHVQFVPSPINRGGYRAINFSSTPLALRLATGELRTVPPRGAAEIADGDAVELAGYSLVFHSGEVQSAAIQARIDLAGTRLEVAKPLEGALYIRNSGDKAGVQFEVSPQGFDEHFLQIEPGPVLFPGVEKRVDFRLAHPRRATPAAGDHTVKFVVTAPDVYPGESAIVSAMIRIAPYYAHTVRFISVLPEMSGYTLG